MAVIDLAALASVHVQSSRSTVSFAGRLLAVHKRGPNTTAAEQTKDRDDNEYPEKSSAVHNKEWKIMDVMQEREKSPLYMFTRESGTQFMVNILLHPAS